MAELLFYRLMCENYAEKNAVANFYKVKSIRFILDKLYRTFDGVRLFRIIKSDFGVKTQEKFMRYDKYRVPVGSLSLKKSVPFTVTYKVIRYEKDGKWFDLFFVDNVGEFLRIPSEYSHDVLKHLNLLNDGQLVVSDFRNIYKIVSVDVLRFRNVFRNMYFALRKFLFFIIKGRSETTESLMNS